jgi:DDE superfamily endonuclease/Tc5 transposase-like DNA-binding protein
MGKSVNDPDYDERMEKALEFHQSNAKRPLIDVAALFNVNRSTLYRRIHAISGPRYGRSRTHGRLDDAQEKALCRYIDRLDAVGLAVRKDFILAAANNILRDAAEVPDDVQGIKMPWITRFLKRYEYTVVPQRTLERDRQMAEDVDNIHEWYLKFNSVIQDEGILPDDIWNMDETGFRIGIGKDQLVVTRKRRVTYLGSPSNRESATLIEYISATGNHLPPLIIMSGERHMSRWYVTETLEDDAVISVTPTGYSNDNIALHWIHHFEQKSRGSMRGMKRLLLLDGHGSHHTKEFIEYCEYHDIIPFGLPPHTTHLMQPLDVVVFQPYKHYHAKAVDILIRDSCTAITKLEFLGMIRDIREETFKTSTIISAFKKTGIHPFNPQIVLQQVLERRAAIRTPSPATPPASAGITPVTIKSLRRQGFRLLHEVRKLDTSLEPLMARFVKGAVTQGHELLQHKRDLARTRMAEESRKARRNARNVSLQSGGILTVADGRKMVRQNENDKLAKAAAIVAASDKRDRARRKRARNDAAMIARRWKRQGRFKKYEDIFFWPPGQ